MIDSYKAVFIPVDDRILNLFKGYTLNGKPLYDMKESDVYSISKNYEFPDSKSKLEIVIRVIVLVPLIPIFIIILLVAAIFKKLEQTSDKIKSNTENFFHFFFRKKMKIRKKEFENVVEENIPEFLAHCRENYVRVYLYTYQELAIDELTKVNNLIESGSISSCQIVSRLSDLIPFVNAEKISVRNSILIISDATEKHEANLLGFYSGNSYERNVVLWKKSKFPSQEGDGELEWNSFEAIVGLKRKIEYYLIAKSNAFFTNDCILFVEDEHDEFLNNYLKTNLPRINRRLSEKGMQLIYFPNFKHQTNSFSNNILEFIQYQLPVFYSLSDSELNETIQLIIQKLSSEQFYRIVLEELELPFFKKPCLLRSISGGSYESQYKFTYTHIEYKTTEHLDNLFDWYISQVRIPNDLERMHFRVVEPPTEYDADWYFGKESKKDTDELKVKIDKIKSEGKFGVLAEAIMYMLETIKDEKPEILKKVKPLIEQKGLLESKVVLSPIQVDKHHNIFLPDFGNVEVKMHALPKTVYLFFLRYPDGIRFKELYQYKSEILDIYNLVTNKYEKEEIERAISDLVDMTKPNINMQCSRIRAAFRNLMDEHIAKYYYIDGMNGEPKKISLPQNLIDIRY